MGLRLTRAKRLCLLRHYLRRRDALHIPLEARVLGPITPDPGQRARRGETLWLNFLSIPLLDHPILSQRLWGLRIEVLVMAPNPAADRAGRVRAAARRERRDMPGDRGKAAGSAAALFDAADQPPCDQVRATGRARAVCHHAQRAVRTQPA